MNSCYILTKFPLTTETFLTYQGQEHLRVSGGVCVVWRQGKHIRLNYVIVQVTFVTNTFDLKKYEKGQISPKLYSTTQR